MQLDVHRSHGAVAMFSFMRWKRRREWQWHCYCRRRTRAKRFCHFRAIINCLHQVDNETEDKFIRVNNLRRCHIWCGDGSMSYFQIRYDIHIPHFSIDKTALGRQENSCSIRRGFKLCRDQIQQCQTVPAFENDRSLESDVPDMLLLKALFVTVYNLCDTPGILYFAHSVLSRNFRLSSSPKIPKAISRFFSIVSRCYISYLYRPVFYF